MRYSDLQWICTACILLSACIDGLKGSLITSSERSNEQTENMVKYETHENSKELDEQIMFHAQQDDGPISTEKLTSYQRIYVNNVMVLLNEIDENYGDEVETTTKSEDDDYAEEEGDDATVRDEPELLSVNGYDSKTEKARISIHRLDHLQYECDIPNDMLESLEFKWKLNGVVVDEMDATFSPDTTEYPSIEKTDLEVSCIFKLNRIEKPIELKFPSVHLDNYKFQNWRPNIYFFKRKYKRPFAVLKVLLVTFAVVGIAFCIGYVIFRRYQAKKKLVGREKEENAQPFLKI